MNKKDFALSYLKNGLSVFPTKGKKPLVKWEPYSKEKPTEDQINEWWAKWLDADIACATGQVSNLIVIDVDGGEVPPLPPTAVSETSPGHYQYFFKHPGSPVANSTKLIGPNIDVRGDGGFCVLPPSNHYDKEGKVDFTYTWKIPPKEGGFAELPKSILEKLKEQKRFDPKVLEGVPEGKRNESAASVIGKILHGLKPEEWKIAGWELITAWNERNKPPLLEKELRTVFESIAKREAQNNLIKPSQYITPLTEIVRVFEPILAKNLSTLPMNEINWVWEGILAKDNLSLLAAREKMGKTSFLEDLLKALVTGGYLFGLKITKSKVVIISEEPKGLWHRRLEKMGLSDCDTLWVQPRPFNTRLKLKEWETWLLEAVTPFCEKNQVDVLILDTISPIWPVLHENDASEVQTALLPLNAIAEKNIAVLAVHHYNKTGGIRGSTVLGAVPSILLDFGKPPGDEETTQRLLKVRSRFEESPEQLLVDYKDREYILLGTPQNVARQEKLSQVKRMLVKFPDGAVIQEIIDAWDEGKKPSRSMLKIYLDDLCFTQSVYVIGTRKIRGGNADIYSLYPNNPENYQGIKKITQNEPNNPVNHDTGAIYKQGSSKVEDALVKALKKQAEVEVHES